MLRLASAGATDTGRKRTNNEDSFLVLDDLRLFAVADGVGGREGGEVASRIAVDTLREAVPDLLGSGDRTPPVVTANGSREASALRSAVSLADRNIAAATEERPQLAGMGTTVTALLFAGSHVHVVHVGDSRAYLLRAGKITQVSHDHSLVAEQVRAGLMTLEKARVSPLRHVITRALGTADATPDLFELDVRKDDVYLLCSDGLTDMVDDEGIGKLLGAAAPKAAAQALVDAANKAGGEDNITVVVVKVLEV